MEYRVKWIMKKQYPNSDETYLETTTKYFTNIEDALNYYWGLEQGFDKDTKEIHLDGIIKIKESIAN